MVDLCCSPYGAIYQSRYTLRLKLNRFDLLWIFLQIDSKSTM